MVPLVLLSMAMILQTVAAENEHENTEEARRHRLEFFLGNTHDGDDDGFSVGLTYEYRLTEILGAGVFWEYAAGDFDKWAAGLPLFIHPYKAFRFLLAPGIDDAGDGNDFLFKAGVAYELEFGRWSITPEFDIDFVDGEEAQVYGLSFGYGF